MKRRDIVTEIMREEKKNVNHELMTAFLEASASRMIVLLWWGFRTRSRAGIFVETNVVEGKGELITAFIVDGLKMLNKEESSS